MSQSPTHEADDAHVIEESWLDPEQFRIIFARYHGAIYRYLTGRCGVETASEIASEVFVVAFSQRTRYDTNYPSAKPWLFGITLNLLSNHFRRAATRSRHPYVMDSDTSEFEDEVVWRVDAEHIAQEAGLVVAINSLRTDERDILLLFALGDLTYTEIAKTLDIPVGTVRSRLSRLRRRLYPLLKDAMNREPI